MASRYDAETQKEEWKHKVKLRKIERKGERILRKRELKAKRDSYKKPRKKIQTTKIILSLLMVIMLLNCLIVEGYSMYVMLVLQDLSALYTLITAVVTTTIGEILAFSVYALKSYAESREQEKITLEREKLNVSFEVSEQNNTEAVG